MKVLPILVNTAAYTHLMAGVGMQDVLLRVGEQVAERAAAAAPQDTGTGAASIHPTAGEDSGGAYVAVSWSDEAFYMLFHEVGTSHQSARPFLRPALDTQYTI